eukprot:TRINITY_DN10930_c0_g1_i2.p1 TRINITY_DN10930_c0_g1~~TRINITY_DN10930_c0_g1_i2.p1  ORF type:complete len:331 (+),score=45.40 TRINITY_DN10930_c0_g1_i2:95-994(+)
MIRGKTELVNTAPLGTPEITLLNWNILASGLASRDSGSGFFKVSEEDLEFENRKKRVVEHIAARSPDIVCLEELDHFDDWYNLQLDKLGYCGVYQPKTQDTIPGFRDGTGIFVKRETLEVTSRHPIIYQAEEKSQNFKQVALALQVKHRSSGVTFFVAATHLKAKAEYDSWRAVQARQLIQRVQELSKDVQSNNGDSIPFIICGDFNAPPDTPAVRTMLDAGFKSVYDIQGGHFTSWAHRPTGSKEYMIDYIWYNDVVTVSSYEALPGKEDIGDKALPCAGLPSDHLPLVASLQLLSSV